MQQSTNSTSSLVITDELTRDVLGRLRAMPYSALQRCVRTVLLAAGYDEVRLLGRVHYSGHNREGGAEIEALARMGGMSETTALVQVKQYVSPVPARYVDELRGCMARRGVGQGVIVATAPFSPVAVRAAKSSSLLPVRLVDAEELVGLMVRHRVGVREGLAVALKLDERFFDQLAFTGLTEVQ